jgi:hypothetical protein
MQTTAQGTMSDFFKKIQLEFGQYLEPGRADIHRINQSMIAMMNEWEELKSTPVQQRNRESDVTTLLFMDAVNKTETFTILHVMGQQDISSEMLDYFVEMASFYVGKDGAMCGSIASVLCDGARIASGNTALLITVSMQCIACGDNELRNSWLRYWNLADNPIIDTLEQCFMDNVVNKSIEEIEKNANDVEALLCMVQASGKMHATDQMVQSVLQIVSNTTHIQLFCAAVLSLESLLYESEDITTETKESVFKTVREYVASSNQQRKMAALDAFSCVTAHTVSYPDPERDITPLVYPLVTDTDMLEQVLQTVSTLVNELDTEKWKSELSQWYCDRYLMVASEMLNGSVRKKYQSDLQAVMTIMLLQSICSNAVWPSCLQNQVIEMLAQIFDRCKNENYVNRVLYSIGKCIVVFKDDMSGLLDRVIDICIDRMDEFLKSDVVLDVEVGGAFNDGALFGYRWVIVAALDYISKEMLHKILSVHDRKKRLCSLLKLSMKKIELREMLYISCSHLLGREMLANVFESEQDGIQFLLGDVLSAAVTDITEHELEERDDSVQSYVINNALCVIAAFARKIMPTENTYKDICYEKFKPLVTHMLNSFSAFVANPLVGDMIYMANFSHVMAVLFFSFPYVARFLFPDVAVAMMISVTSNMLDRDDNVDIVYALRGMLEWCLENQCDGSRHTLRAFLVMFGDVQTSLVSRLPESVHDVKRAVAAARILASREE